MPYRRLPNTDSSRLKALETLLENNDIYTARERFLQWKDINEARTLYDKLLTATKQYDMDRQAQRRSASRIEPLQRKAYLYLSHFIQVLLMGIMRGEIKRSALKLYGMQDDATQSPLAPLPSSILEWAPKIVEGEKERIKRGGRPIYNPSIGMVQTHFDIFSETYAKQKQLQQRTHAMEQKLKQMRPDIDSVILRIWDQIEAHFSEEGKLVADRVEDCQRFGVRYYLRRKEKRAKQAENEQQDK